MDDQILIPVSSAPTLVRIAIKKQYPNAEYYSRKGRRYFALVKNELKPISVKNTNNHYSARLNLAGEWRQ